MSDFVLHAEPRVDLRKGASRRLRRQGKIPAILYGGGKAPEPLTLDHDAIFHNLENEAFYSSILTVRVGGVDQKAVLKDLQRHPAKAVIMHVDLQRVDESHAIRVHVPLHFVNEDMAPGVKKGGVVSHLMVEVEVECLPQHLPEFIEVDLSGLDVGESIHLSELALPEGVRSVELMHGPEHDLAVVSIHPSRTARGEEEEGGETGAEEGGEQ